MSDYTDKKKHLQQYIPKNQTDIQQQEKQSQQQSFMILNNGNFNNNFIQQQQIFNQNQFITKPNLENNANLLEALKEKADEVQYHDDQKSTKSSNSKNAYIKKIITLCYKPQDSSQIVEESDKINSPHKKKIKIKSEDDSLDNLEQEGIDRDQIKLARNRESARNSRKRKRIYLELLENKVTQLQDFLQQSKVICNRSEKLLQNLQNQINYKNENLNTKNILSKNLRIALESNTSEIGVNSIVEQLKNKFGTVNQEKIVILDYFFKQISEQVLPVHIQYLLFVISEGKDIFQDDQDAKSKFPTQKISDNDFPNIMNTLNLTEEQKQKALKISKQLYKERKKIQSEINNLFDLKEDMKKELFSLNDTFEQLRKLYKPSQIAKFIIQIEMNSTSEYMKNSLNKFFASQEDNNYEEIDDDDDEQDFFEKLKNEDQTNVLFVDINETYDVFAAAYDFVTKKKKLSREDKQ